MNFPSRPQVGGWNTADLHCCCLCCGETHHEFIFKETISKKCTVESHDGDRDHWRMYCNISIFAVLCSEHLQGHSRKTCCSKLLLMQTEHFLLLQLYIRSISLKHKLTFIFIVFQQNKTTVWKCCREWWNKKEQPQRSCRRLAAHFLQLLSEVSSSCLCALMFADSCCVLI